MVVVDHLCRGLTVNDMSGFVLLEECLSRFEIPICMIKGG
jgi:hypothetical protein